MSRGNIFWVTEHRSARIGFGRDHGLSFASGGCSSLRRILMPLKSDPLETFPRIAVSSTISVIAQRPDRGFPEGRYVPKGALAADTRWTELFDLTIFFFEPLLTELTF